MPDTKISDMPDATLPLGGDELVPLVQSGDNVKARAADIAFADTVFVTLFTDAGGTTLTIPDVSTVYIITTDGSGGNQNVEIPLPPLSAPGGFGNSDILNMTVAFQIDNLSDPADVVTFTSNADPQLRFIPYVSGQPSIVTDVRLTYQGAFVIFRWCYEHWYVDTTISNGDFDYSLVPNADIRLQNDADGGPTYVRSGDGATLDAGQLYIKAGDGTLTGKHGGNIEVEAGDSLDDQAGNLTLKAGASSDPSKNGHILYEDIAVGDPLIAGAAFIAAPLVAGVPQQLWISGG